MKSNLSNQTKAQDLRKSGLSYDKISKLINVAPSTVYGWTKHIQLSNKQLIHLASESNKGRALGREKRLTALHQQQDKLKLLATKSTDRIFKKCSKDLWQVTCAQLYWCEGSKPSKMNCLVFTNSDPELIKFYLKSLRNGFEIVSSKFRIQLHLHEYHEAERQIKYWSLLTSIPVKQFNKPYLKPHTGKRQKEDYPGCISIRYYDAAIAKHVKFLYNAIAKHIGA